MRTMHLAAHRTMGKGMRTMGQGKRMGKGKGKGKGKGNGWRQPRPSTNSLRSASFPLTGACTTVQRVLIAGTHSCPRSPGARARMGTCRTPRGLWGMCLRWMRLKF